ncbi:hypothetical protein KKF84_05545 [Myxococcota bacterium]|nr:hypothetical protein [Myxococcota bacterium]MBU1534762.1 hypothetical protein [Myxococcota bacterium]
MFACTTESGGGSENCGDGIIDIGEECDGDNIGEESCASHGYYTGTLTCNSDCTLNLVQCIGQGFCGDGVINMEFGEECDGDELDEQDCETLGFYEGSVACTDSCAFDTSQCMGRCGDGEITHGEECDGENFGEMTVCSDLHPMYHSGTLTCTSECLISEEECNYCGDGIINGDEECDGVNVGEATCHSEDPLYYDAEGTLACDDVCTLEFAQCNYCGDGLINGVEVCDGTNIGTNLTCNQKGYPGGDPDCDSDCAAIDYIGCNKWNQISTGHAHTCAIDTLGRVWCWGQGLYGRLGIGTSTDEQYPQEVSLPDWATSISAGYEHTCATVAGGEVYCWGRNNYGQLGSDDTTDRSTPNQVYGTTSVHLQVSTGYRHTCSVTSSGMIMCWGDNSYGKVGRCSTTGTTLTPGMVRTSCTSPFFLNDAKEVHVGDSHTCARTGIGINSRVYCWGSNSDGRLGLNMTSASLAYSDYARPILTNGGEYVNAIKISVGSNHSCLIGLGSNYYVRCWGNGVLGKLGNGGTADAIYPSYVLTDPGNSGSYLGAAIRMATGPAHTCVLTTSGGNYCWGDNTYYTLANGTNVNTNFAVEATLINDTETVQCGNMHTCWLSFGGEIYCVGYNGNGRLGDGTTIDAHATPTQVVLP